MTRTADNDAGFKIFWDKYALKREKDAARRAWDRLSSKDRKKALEGIVPYREDCLRRGVSMMYAQGYLNHRRWEDEAIYEHPSNALAKMEVWD